MIFLVSCRAFRRDLSRALSSSALKFQEQTKIVGESHVEIPLFSHSVCDHGRLQRSGVPAVNPSKNSETTVQRISHSLGVRIAPAGGFML
jgi:hypothetical protein